MDTHANTLDEAVAFLERLRPAGPWVLTAILPDPVPGQPPTITITANRRSEIRDFVSEHNGRRNLYYSVNPTRVATTKKASKTNIAAIEFALADCDPRDDESPEDAKQRYLVALKIKNTEVPPPTFIVDSGNGLQFGWRLAAPLTLPPLGNGELNDEAKTTTDDVEARFKAVMERLGAKAGTQNIDRILRLPWTENLPNAAKRKHGRVPCQATLIEFNDGVHGLDAFPLPPKEEPKPRDATANAEVKLPLELRLMLGLTGESPGGYETRSHLLWAFIHSALRKGLDDYAIVDAATGTVEGSSIGDHVRENGGERYIKSQIERALNAAPATGEGVIIRWEAGTLDKVWRQTERVMIDADVPVYVRGGRLVQPLWRWEKSAGERDALTIQFVSYNVARLGDVVAHQARIQYQKFDKRSKKWVNVDPPDEVMDRLIVIGHWSFPTVVGLGHQLINRNHIRMAASLTRAR